MTRFCISVTAKTLAHPYCASQALWNTVEPKRFEPSSKTILAQRDASHPE